MSDERDEKTIDEVDEKVDEKVFGRHLYVPEVSDADVPPTSHALPLTNVFREDVPVPCDALQIDERSTTYAAQLTSDDDEDSDDEQHR